MKKRKYSLFKFIGLLFAAMAMLAFVIIYYSRGKDFILFNPKGFVSNHQTDLMINSILAMLVIAIPTLIVLYTIAWRYRDTNNRSAYKSESGQSWRKSLILWTLPAVIVAVLIYMMVPATFKLEPQERIEASNDTMTIQVVALRWKWLFLYPGQDVASVNYVQIPLDTPIEFIMTTDETPMTSFWIPHLGGQLYAMTEHVNRLNVMADTPGDYPGSTAEINGAGFSGMRFNTRVSTREDFDKWMDNTRSNYEELDQSTYNQLLEPSTNNPEEFYSGHDADLFGTIVSKYAGSHNHGVNQNTGHEGH